MTTLEEEEFRLFMLEMPGIILMLFVCVIGTTGNLHVVFVYSLNYKSSNYRNLIVMLGTVDLFACIVMVPLTIDHLRHFYSTSNFVCSLFLPHFVSFSSVFLLATIAVERFRKVCQPLNSQFEQKHIIIICICIIIVSLLLSIPALIFYGSEIYWDQDLNNTVSICAFPKDGQDAMLVHVYNAIPPLFGSISMIVCLVIYIIIGRLIYRKVKSNEFLISVKSSRRRSSNNGTTDFTETTNDSNQTIEEVDRKENVRNTEHKENTSEDKVNDIEEITTINQTPDIATIETVPSCDLKIKPIKSKYNRTLQITLMLILATAASYIFYLISVVCLIILPLNDISIKAEENLGGGYVLLEQIYLLSNAINPIIYGFFDPKFRQKICKMYGNVLTCWRACKC